MKCVDIVTLDKKNTLYHAIDFRAFYILDLKFVNAISIGLS